MKEERTNRFRLDLGTGPYFAPDPLPSLNEVEGQFQFQLPMKEFFLAANQPAGHWRVLGGGRLQSTPDNFAPFLFTLSKPVAHGKKTPHNQKWIRTYSMT
jgi:hypothetical protein